MNREEIAIAMEVVQQTISSFSNPDINVSGVCRDSDDDNILGCVVAANADYLVTGDTDLLVIGHFDGVKIVTPRDFESLFR